MSQSSASSAGHEEWLTVKEAAAVAKASEPTIRRWLKDGLPSHRKGRGTGGGKHRIARSDLDAFIRADMERQKAAAAAADDTPTPDGGASS